MKLAARAASPASTELRLFLVSRAVAPPTTVETTTDANSLRAKGVSSSSYFLNLLESASYTSSRCLFYSAKRCSYSLRDFYYSLSISLSS